MTNNTEPLKVGECLKEFEKEFRKQYGILPGNNIQSFPEYHKSLAFYQAAWNRRTEPSPAEVSIEGALKPLAKVWVLDEDLNQIQAVPAEGYFSEAQLRQALSQQSPATVEGELTDEEAFKLWIETQLTSVYPVDTKEFKGLFARAIESALNQRLAVKEGEPDYYAFTSAEDRHFNEKPRLYKPDELTSAEKQESFACYTHPVSDDQQAKDAALLRDLKWRIDDIRDDLMGGGRGHSVYGIDEWSVPAQNLKKASNLIERHLPAKQEEV